jgi:hypothetical protein
MPWPTFGAWHLKPDPIVGGDLQHEQVGIGLDQRRHHVAEVRDIGRLRRAGHHGVRLRRDQDVRANSRGNS